MCYTILENWSPREISKFQACYLMYGKNFGEFKVHVSIFIGKLHTSSDLKASFCFVLKFNLIQFLLLLAEKQNPNRNSRILSMLEADPLL